MGSEAKKIVGVDVKKLLNLLNKAYADEWLAYYQYWVGAKIAVGNMRPNVSAELEEHAGEELKHAAMLADRIIVLGGELLLSWQDILKETTCGYLAPTNPKVEKLLEQNIKGEQCAIRVYKKLLDFVKDKDPVTYDLVLDILKEEIEHEQDLQNLLDDLKT
jgi:bacterioferritin